MSHLLLLWNLSTITATRHSPWVPWWQPTPTGTHCHNAYSMMYPRSTVSHLKGCLNRAVPWVWTFTALDTCTQPGCRPTLIHHYWNQKTTSDSRLTLTDTSAENLSKALCRDLLPLPMDSCGAPLLVAGFLQPWVIHSGYVHLPIKGLHVWPPVGAAGICGKVPTFRLEFVGRCL